VYSVQINKQNPLQEDLKTNIPAELLSGATLILIDDVQNSGRTLAYTLKHFLQFPLISIQTCVLVDRRHNYFPVKADYIGLSLSTTLQEHVQVEVNGDDVSVTLH
jgi:pyrimidine operon attenuation protein/uracil phosphoribosyltransferase